MKNVMTPIPFNRPHATGREFDYIREAISRIASRRRRDFHATLRSLA